MSLRPRPALVVTSIAFLIAIAGLCTSAMTGQARAVAFEPSPGAPKRMLVIGDSVLLGAKDHIPQALPGWQVDVDAAVSRSTQAGLDVIAAHGTDYDVVVVQLGTNDGGSPGVFTPRAAAVLDALAPVPHVVWLTIREVRPYYAQTNAVIRELVARHPNARVGDWNAVSSHTDVAGDGLHLTPAGAQRISALIAELADDAVASTTTTSTTSTTTSTTSTTSTTTSTTSTTTTTTTTTAAPTTTSTTPAAPVADESSTSGRPVWAGVAGVVVIAAGGGVYQSIRRRRAQG